MKCLGCLQRIKEGLINSKWQSQMDAREPITSLSWTFKLQCWINSHKSCLCAGGYHEPVPVQSIYHGWAFVPKSRNGKQRLSELAVLLSLQPEPLRPFIHASVCLLKEKVRLSSSSQGETNKEKKKRHARTGTEQVLSLDSRPPNWRRQTQCCLHLSSKTVRMERWPPPPCWRWSRLHVAPISDWRC